MRMDNTAAAEPARLRGVVVDDVQNDLDARAVQLLRRRARVSTATSQA